MKYIKFKTAGIILFEKHIEHSAMAQKFPTDEVLSAGFVSGVIEPNQIDCYGESVTLKKSAKDEDSDTLYRRLSPYA